MTKQFYNISQILNEVYYHPSNTSITPEEQAKRKRMIKRMATLGMAAGAGVTAGELMLHPASRRLLMRAAKKPGTMTKIGGIAKQVWKPMALGIGADLAIEPTNVKISQAMEDRLQKRKQQKQLKK